MKDLCFNVYRTPNGTMYQGLAVTCRAMTLNGGGNLRCYRVRIKFKQPGGCYVAPHIAIRYADLHRSVYR